MSPNDTPKETSFFSVLPSDREGTRDGASRPVRPVVSQTVELSGEGLQINSGSRVAFGHAEQPGAQRSGRTVHMSQPAVAGSERQQLVADAGAARADPVDRETAARLARQTWASSPEIRAEFTSQEAFVAYRVAMSRGQIKVFIPGRRGGQ